MKFSKLKVGTLFMSSGSEYVKVRETGAIPISPIISYFGADEVVMPSKEKSTTISNWKSFKR